MADQLALVEQAFRHAVARAPDGEPVLVLRHCLEQHVGGDADDAILAAQVVKVVCELRLDAEEPVAAPAGLTHVDEGAVARRELVIAFAVVEETLPSVLGQYCDGMDGVRSIFRAFLGLVTELSHALLCFVSTANRNNSALSDIATR